MSLSRESHRRDWDSLLTQYMRFYYHQDCIRLFGTEWIRSWHVPIRDKLAALLNRACICGAATDHFDHVQKTRLCVDCARETYRFTYSLTTPLFYDDEAFAILDVWTQDPVALLETVPVGKRVDVNGCISAEYSNIVITQAIWICGFGTKRSTLNMGSCALIIQGSAQVTDLSICNGPRQDLLKSRWRRPDPECAYPAIQIMPVAYYLNVSIAGCFISGRAGAGILALGGHVRLRHNYFKWCAHAAIAVCHGGTVHAVGNRFRRLLSCCFQTGSRPNDWEDFVATFRANNHILSRSPHFNFNDFEYNFFSV